MRIPTYQEPNPDANKQAIPLRNGSNTGGGSAPTPQAKLTTTGQRFGKMSGPIETRKGR